MMHTKPTLGMTWS